MADEPHAAMPQAGDDEHIDPKPQAGEPSTPPTEPQAGDSQTPASETISLEEAKKLRSEANGLRKRLKAFDDAKAEADAAALSETDRLKKQLTEAQTQLETASKAAQAYRLQAEVRAQALSLGFADPSDATPFLDTAQLEYDEDGTPTNVKTLLQALLKSKPYLAGKTPAATSGGATNPSRSASSGTSQALSWDVISKLSAEQYQARRGEIQQWINTHPHSFGQPMR